MEVERKHYQQLELTATAAAANTQALAFVLPLMVLYLVPYVVLWHEQFSAAALEGLVQEHGVRVLFLPLLMLLVFIPGAVLHELLHGLTWAAFCEKGLRSIQYGVHWAALTPYCHCKEVLPLKPYILGGLMPGLVMGLLPALVGTVMGNPWVFFFGLFFSVAAAGDLLVLWMLRKCRPDDLVQDHPEKIGCYVLRRV
ncbi:putative zincin peptidase [Pontibacter ummariensis]|uniref:Putative zincin peptidase n=1 Tax=Pontibacter ummariensis TaxID=1610492 RepID=A0A239L7S3_9BACT|nr:DUF3267 domain-containing protein [Pontibacter ummariensis]PRY03996.1 putative zincin peptidase [Pontibacter ummariensis]SNT26677.1 Putative zincin peptidase [Pontibacter ummariensis]